MKVYERVREYIESNGIKFNHVAEKSGIPMKKFYRLLDGSSTLTVDDYEHICEFGLSLSPGYFLGQNFLDSKNTNFKTA